MNWRAIASYSWNSRPPAAKQLPSVARNPAKNVTIRSRGTPDRGSRSVCSLITAIASSFSGDRPSNTLLLPRLDPYHLGALLALYEHRAYVQGVLWNVNSFDQFGVQLGKQAAERVQHAMEKGDFGPHDKRLDASTRRLISRVRGTRK